MYVNQNGKEENEMAMNDIRNYKYAYKTINGRGM